MPWSTWPGYAPIDATLVLAGAWLLLGITGLFAARRVRFIAHVVFPLGALVGLAMLVNAVVSIGAPVGTRELLLGLPDLPFHARQDALSCVFLAILGGGAFGISLFAAGYFREGPGAAPGLIGFQYHVFLASMAGVLLADDAYAFMVTWESMALSSYFLVITQHKVPAIQRAGFLYLLLAHIGALAILLSFGVLQGGSWQFTFDAMRAAPHAAPWASVAFFLALIGFGAKAGLLPLHVWLPEAHPAAPSPVSALLSGVMLKMALYGILRVALDLIGEPLWWWGLATLAIGLATALFGVVFAAVQTDMKRLLAYSSVENLGIAFTGAGLTLLFRGFGLDTLAAIALLATLYHGLNHACFKSLLFLATGSVLHATGERNLGKLGGLIHRMPWVAGLALIGTLAIAGLPPLNGFVAEWLLLQVFLFTAGVPQPFIDMLVPLGAALLALVAALSAYVMVKFYGVIFLGRPREPALAHAHDAGLFERLGLGWFALACVLLGVLPVFVLRWLEAASVQLLGASLGERLASWWLLSPISAERASYGPVALLAGLAVMVALTALIVRHFYHARVRRSPAWDCGFGRLDARMQDTAEGFGQPIRRIFAPFFAITRTVPAPPDREPVYAVRIDDPLWAWLYRPIGRAVQSIADHIAGLQRGKVATYLLYSFLTLLGLLVLVL